MRKREINLGFFLLCGFFILFAFQMLLAQKTKVEVTAVEGRVRSEPNVKSEIIGLAQKGQILDAEGRIGDWIKVIFRLDEKGALLTGYLLISDVRIIAAEEEKPTVRPAETPAVEEKVRRDRAFQMEYGVRFLGGGEYLFGQNDFNDHLIGEYHDLFNYYQEYVCGKLRPVQLAIDSRAEFFVNLFPSTGVGLGVGYMRADRKSKLKIPRYLEIRHPITTAIPLTLSFYSGIPAGKKLTISAQAGLGYYLGQIVWNTESVDYIDDNWEIGVEWKAKSSALGFHGGLEFEWALSDNIAVLFTGMGRFGKFKDISGTLNFEAVTPEGVTTDSVENLTLWSIDRLGRDGVFRSFGLYEEEPVELTEYRLGEISLNALSFQIGLKIRLNKILK